MPIFQMYQKVYFYSLCSLFLKYPYLMRTKKCIFFLYFCHLSSRMAAVSTHEFYSSKDIFQNRTSMSSPVKCNVRYISLCQNRTTCLYMWCNIDISLCNNQTSSPYLCQCKIELEYHLYTQSPPVLLWLSIFVSREIPHTHVICVKTDLSVFS